MSNIIQRTKNFLSKYKWLISILILSLAILILCPFYIKISFLLLIIFSPFIYLIIISTKGNQSSKSKILGLPTKDFMTIWIAFWGLLGIFGGIIQVQRQISNQDKQLRDSRFFSGIELLGNQNESTRIGSAYNLYFLASEYPEEYLNPVCEILCAHIRSITNEKDYQEKHKERPSLETRNVLNLLLFKKDKNNKLIFNDCVKILEGAFLCGADFSDAVLNNIHFCKTTTLDNAYFFRSTLNDVCFKVAKLDSIFFSDAVLKNCHFCGHATLNEVVFINTTLDNVCFVGTTLSNVSFIGTELSKSTFYHAEFGHVSFSNTKLNEVKFDDAELKNVSFQQIELLSKSNSVLSKSTFYGAEFGCVSFFDTELNEVDFHKAKKSENFSYVSFRNTVLDGYSFEEITREGRSLELTKGKRKKEY